MKKIILILALLIISASGYAQGDRVSQKDSIKTGSLSKSFLLESKHIYNSFMLKTLLTTDSIFVFHILEGNVDTLEVALIDMNTNNELNSNLITGLTGKREFLIVNPNIYRLLLKGANGLSHTIYINRRGNNRK